MTGYWVACVVQSRNQSSATGDLEWSFHVYGGATRRGHRRGSRPSDMSLHLAKINIRVACKSRDGLEEKVRWYRHGLTRVRVPAGVTSTRADRIVCR